MIAYIKNLFKKFKEAKTSKKIIICFILFVYLCVVLGCLIPIKVDYTTPGTLNRINQVITFKEQNEQDLIKNNFYTVSVFTGTENISIFEYLFRKADKKQDVIEYEVQNHIYTVNEESRAGASQKAQSIQDSIICAYNLAKEDGYDVNLIKEYIGVMICYMPQNHYGTGPESIQIQDVIIKIGEVEIDSVHKLYEVCSYYLESDRYKDSNIKAPEILIQRSGEILTLKSCNTICLAHIAKMYESSEKTSVELKIDNKYSYLCNFMFEYYKLDVDNSKPAFNINTATSIGPSGGLCQTLYVYNALTNNSLIKENELITATGTIIYDGTIGPIGAIDKKVYTIDIYMSKYFFVPSLDYDDAISAYNTIKDPEFEVISVSNVRDAIDFLKGGK